VVRKVCIINQPEELGDILYIQKIGHHFKSLGYEIFWPVCPAYCNIISDYLPDFNYYCNNDESVLELFNQEVLDVIKNHPGQKGKIFSGEVGDIDLKVIPTNHLNDNAEFQKDSVPLLSLMSKKYAFVGLSDQDWPDYVNLKRNSKKENELFYDVLGLKDEDDYAFVNSFLGTQPHHVSNWTFIVDEFKKSDSHKNGMSFVKLEFIEGFTVFDWLKVFERAKEIWMEGSSLTWLAEKVEMQAEKFFLWSRNGPGDLNLFYKFTHDWKFHQDLTFQIPKLNSFEQ